MLASQNSLYYETGWETLALRGNEKLQTRMYKIYHNMVPTHFTDIRVFPYNCLLESNYVTRTSHNYNIPK